MDTVPPIILLSGPEEYLLEQRIKEIIARLSREDGSEPEVIQLDSSDTQARELDQYLAEVPLFSYRRVVVIRNPVWLEKTKKGGPKEYETVIQSFSQRRPAQLHLIITTGKSGSGAIAGVIKKVGQVVEVPGMNPRQMSAWVTEELGKLGLKIEREALNILTKSGRDLNYLAREIERLGLCHPGKTITPQDLTGIESDLTGVNTFRLTDALLRKNVRESLKALASLLEKGEPVPLIVHMIAREMVLLGKVQALTAQGESLEAIAGRLGKQPFRVDKMRGSALRGAELPRVFAQLAELDYAIKNTSQDHRLLLEATIVDICAG